MDVLIYVGPAPSRDMVITFSAPIVQAVASRVTLVTGGGSLRRSLLDDAATRLAIPAHVPVTQRALNGNAQTAILTAAREQPHDLVILGRLHQSIGRLLPGPRSKAITQQLEPSVLRVQGETRPIRRILLASGGDHSRTLANAAATVPLAVPLNSHVLLLHVVSQQSVVFEEPSQHMRAEAFLSSDWPEAQALRQATQLLSDKHVSSQVKVRFGPVIDEILEELRDGEYDLLVIGVHRIESALDRILLEDLTGDLLDTSPVPVLVVKDDSGAHR